MMPGDSKHTNSFKTLSYQFVQNFIHGILLKTLSPEFQLLAEQCNGKGWRALKEHPGEPMGALWLCRCEEGGARHSCGGESLLHNVW